MSKPIIPMVSSVLQRAAVTRCGIVLRSESRGMPSITVYNGSGCRAISSRRHRYGRDSDIPHPEFHIIMRRTAALPTIAVLFALTLPACAAPAPATPTPTATPTASASPTPSPTPTAEAIEPTCENTSTAQFQQMMAENGWISWTGRVPGVDWSPFEDFPTDPSAEGIVCTWGKDPDLATDNIITLAWAPISSVAATAAQEQLRADGYERIDAAEGTYLALVGEEGTPVDGEGYHTTYLFTGDDVRWAEFKEYVGFVIAPDDAE
jgi:hypothetical protein